MKIKPFVSRLEGSETYKKFLKDYKDAYLMAGFFVIDYESGQKIVQLDYYIPSLNKVAAFTLDKKYSVQILDLVSRKQPNKLDLNSKIDLEALYGILEDEMKNRNITEEIKKIVAVVQNNEGKLVWNLNCVLSGLSILNAHVDDETESILKMEKKNILDFVKKMPYALQEPSNGKKVGEVETASEEKAGVGEDYSASPKSAKNQAIEQVSKLLEALKKQKEEMQKETSASDLKEKKKTKKSK